jgi:hypothetical protein
MKFNLVAKIYEERQKEKTAKNAENRHERSKNSQNQIKCEHQKNHEEIFFINHRG